MLRSIRKPSFDTRGLPRRGFLRVAVASAGALWFAPSIAQAQPEGWKGLLGMFDYAGDAAEDAARLKAIDDVVDQMSPIVRGIARSKLKKATAIAAHVRLTLDGHILTVADDKRADSAPTDGTVVKITVETGDEMDLSYDLKDTEIVELVSDGSKGAVQSFTLDGDNLVVRHAVFASQLPAKIIYRTTYRRSTR
jgi:hypothetical protein